MRLWIFNINKGIIHKLNSNRYDFSIFNKIIIPNIFKFILTTLICINRTNTSS